MRKHSIPFHLLGAEDIVRGALESYRVLLVPGGWASHKMRALGEEGKRRISEFVAEGGSYLGFCGGAGLALSSSPSLELVPLDRRPLPERLPNASGEILIRGITDHPVWQGLPQDLPVSIWWPSQFAWQLMPRSLCLAVYAATGADFWVADLPVADLQGQGRSWESLEKIYGINLDPGRLLGEPAIFEIRRGKGRLVLSYPHLETPGDSRGNQLFLNILEYLDEKAARHLPRRKEYGHLRGHPAFSPLKSPAHVALIRSSPHGLQTLDRLLEAQEVIDDLIAFGERHLLWHWHKPWLLRWQRGIRGLEYGTLAVALRFLVQELRQAGADGRGSADPRQEPVAKLGENVVTFCRLAKRLLLEEKLAGQTGHLTKLGKVNDTIDPLRATLFGNKMNHGGLCRLLLDALDRLLFQILRSRTEGASCAEDEMPPAEPMHGSQKNE